MKCSFLSLMMVVLFTFTACAKKNEVIVEPPENQTGNTFASPQQINQRLGRGINLGNIFEAHPIWGNPRYSHDYLQNIASLGFNHVRIPIRWERDDRSSKTAPYTINKVFLDSLKQVINHALKNKLHVIINMHHHDSLTANPAANKERFLAQWKQIADYFKAYPDSLLFEVLNEPHDKLTPELWNQYFAEALSEIRKTNPERTVLLGVADWGGVTGLGKLNIPTDNHLILTIHYYNPFQFTHQGAEWVDNSTPWIGTKWSDYEYERDAVMSDFKRAKAISIEKNIPIHVGEFGAYSKADMDSRVKWTRYVARYFEQMGFSWAYWEYNSGFGIVDGNTGQPNTRLINALLHDQLPPATLANLQLLYESNFSAGKDGWDLYNNHTSASATMNITSGKANISFAQQGSEGWHIQLIKNNVNIEQGKKYLIQFNAYSTALRSLGVSVMQREAPWTNYGNGSIDIDATDTQYSFVFTSAAGNPAAGIVFSLGNNGLLPVTLYNIRLFEIGDGILKMN